MKKMIVLGMFVCSLLAANSQSTTATGGTHAKVETKQANLKQASAHRGTLQKGQKVGNLQASSAANGGTATKYNLAGKPQTGKRAPLVKSAVSASNQQRLNQAKTNAVTGTTSTAKANQQQVEKLKEARKHNPATLKMGAQVPQKQ